MVKRKPAPYSPNYMQSWTDWFRERQEAFGSHDDFVRATDGVISLRMLGNYRAGAVPRRAEKIEAISKVLGEAGPLPEPERARKVSVTARLTALEARVAKLEEASGGRSDPSAPAPTREGSSGVASSREAKKAKRKRQPRPARHPPSA